MRKLYLLLAVLGAVIPYLVFVPWVAHNGLSPSRLWAEIAGSRLSEFAWLDVGLSVLTIVVFAAVESRRIKMPFPLLPILACFLVGASCGLPLFLYQREKYLSQSA